MNTLNSCKIIAFVPASNLARAKEFYRITLGFKLISDESFGMMFDVSGSLLRVIHMEQVFAPRHTIVGWKVPNISAVVEELTRKDIPFERYQGFDQDEQGIWNAPDGSRVAWFRDPDGNILSVTQFPPMTGLTPGAGIRFSGTEVQNG